MELDKSCRSARSLAGSGTPPFRTYLRDVKSGPSAMELNGDSSDDEASPNLSENSTQPRPIPHSVSVSLSLLFFFTSFVITTRNSYLYNHFQ